LYEDLDRQEGESVYQHLPFGTGKVVVLF